MSGKGSSETNKSSEQLDFGKRGKRLPSAVTRENLSLLIGEAALPYLAIIPFLALISASAEKFELAAFKSAAPTPN